jgi:hypothetical protein
LWIPHFLDNRPGKNKQSKVINATNKKRTEALVDASKEACVEGNHDELNHTLFTRIQTKTVA